MNTEQMRNQLIHDLSNGYSPKDLIWTIVHIVEDRAKETSAEEAMKHFGFWSEWDEEDEEQL